MNRLLILPVLLLTLLVENPAFSADFQKGLGAYDRGDYATALRATGVQLSAEKIASSAAAFSSDADATMARYEERMARALATVINLLDSDIIVLGGGVSNIARLYENVPKLWQLYLFSENVTTKNLPARHGDAAGVRGAVWLWPADGRDT